MRERSEVHVVLAALLLSSACGRVDYDGQGPGADASADADALAPDAHGADASADASADAASDAPPDGAVDAGVPPLDCSRFPTAIVCDPFETLRPEWSIVTWPAGAPGVVEIDASTFRSGAASLHTRGGPAIASMKLVGKYLGGITSGDLHVRGYYRLGAPVYGVSVLHVVDDVDPFPGLVVEIVDGSSVHLFSTIDGRSGTAGGTVPIGVWFCLQLEIHVDAAAGTVRMLVDGTEATTLGPTSTVPANGYSDVHAGIFVNLTQEAPVDLWVDELIADTAPVPCD